MLRNIRILYLHNLLTDFRFHSPFLVIYFQQVTGSYTLATLALALEVISAAVLDIPTGVFSDKIGRKYTLALGSGCYALTLVCYASAHSLAPLIAGALLFGLSYALFSGNNNALLYESLKAVGKEKEFHHYQGRTSSMFQIGLGVSALIASFIAPHGLRIVFICSIVPQVLAAILSFFVTEPRTHIHVEEKNFAHIVAAAKQVFHNPRLRLLTITHAISLGFNETLFMFTPVFVNRVWPAWAVAVYRALSHSSGFLGYWYSGRILDRIKPAQFLPIASAYWLVTELLAVFMANVVSPVLIASGSGFFGTYMTAFSHLLQQEFTDKQRATMSSVMTFASSLSSGLVAILLGAVADRFGIIIAMITGILGSSLALPIYLRFFGTRF
jgi:MFS family permease